MSQSRKRSKVPAKYKKVSVVELRKTCQVAGIKGYSGLNKAQLVKLCNMDPDRAAQYRRQKTAGKGCLHDKATASACLTRIRRKYPSLFQPKIAGQFLSKDKKTVEGVVTNTGAIKKVQGILRPPSLAGVPEVAVAASSVPFLRRKVQNSPSLKAITVRKRAAVDRAKFKEELQKASRDIQELVKMRKSRDRDIIGAKLECAKRGQKYSIKSKGCRPCPPSRPVLTKTSLKCHPCPYDKPVFNKATMKCEMKPQTRTLLQQINRLLGGGG